MTPVPCAHDAALVYLDEFEMCCTACGTVLPRVVGRPAVEVPADPEERIADALEDIAKALRVIAYPEVFLIPPPDHLASIAASLTELASCVHVGHGDLFKGTYLRTTP